MYLRYCHATVLPVTAALFAIVLEFATVRDDVEVFW